MAQNVIEAVISLKNQFTPTLEKVNKSLSDTVKKVENSKRTFKTMGKNIYGTGKSIKSFGDGMTKNVTLPVLAMATAGVKASSDFETSFAKLSTIADTSARTGVSVDKLKSQLKNLSLQTGASQKDLAEATYSAISAGRSTKDAVAFVGQAGKLAKGGFTDMKTSVDTLTTIMNAYGKSAGTASQISDRLIMTQNLGKTTVNELGQSIGAVIPTANMYGVSLNQLASAYVTTTKNGIQTAQSTTAINATISELGKSGTKASTILQKSTGKSFKDLMKSGMSLTQVLKIVENGAKKQGKSIGDVFSNKNAIKGAATLTAHAKDFNSALKQMGNSTGVAGKAAGKMNDTTAVKLKKMKAQIEALLIDIGNAVIPVLGPVLKDVSKVITKIASAFNKLSPAQKEMIVKFALTAATVGPVVSKIGSMTMGFGKFVMNAPKTITTIKKIGTGIRGAGKAMIGLITANPTILIIIGVIAALAAIAFVVYKNWGKITKFFSKIWKALKAGFKSFVNWVKNTFVKNFDKAFKRLQKIFPGCTSSIKSAFSGIRQIFGGLIDFVTGVFTGNWKKAWKGIVNVFKGIWKTITSFAKAPINFIIDAINSLIKGMNKVSFKAPNWVPIIGGKKFGINIPLIPKLAKGTDDWTGGLAQVSERGGEVIDLPKGSRVYPHNESMKMINAMDRLANNPEKGAGNITINISKLADSLSVRSNDDIEAIASELANELMLQIGNLV